VPSNGTRKGVAEAGILALGQRQEGAFPWHLFCPFCELPRSFTRLAYSDEEHNSKTTVNRRTFRRTTAMDIHPDAFEYGVFAVSDVVSRKFVNLRKP